MNKTVSIHAMAKVNLGLDVLRKREDGYHEVKMVMQTVDLYDTLTFSEKEAQGIEIHCNDKTIPVDHHNLIYQAASLFFEESKKEKGVTITLVKKIPVAAGMAGGSTDAAATLLALNYLYNTGYSKEKLAEMGVKIGADVPYCIYGGTYLSEGIGECLSPLSGSLEGTLVIAKPKFGVSTKYVYENLQLEKIKKHPNIDAMVNAIENSDLQGMTDYMENILETVTEREYPDIRRMKTILKENGALNALMSGSGPTVFGVFQSKEKAEHALSKLKESGLVEKGCVTGFSKSQGMVCEEESYGHI